jgi:hypothetical protein
LSVRSGGLPYNEAASFSLKPTLLFKAFLPPLVWEPPFSEYVAYVGLIGLVLTAVGAWTILRKKQPGGAILGLALVGLFLAFGAYNPVYYLLYKLIPGFALFRAPARWLLLYSFGTAILAGIALEILAKFKRWHLLRAGFFAGTGRLGTSLRKFKHWRLFVILLLVIELFIAGRKLAYNNPTAPAAFDSMRTAPAHLLADAVHESLGEPFRFLSMSDLRYDPGDLADLQAMYGDQLPEEAIYDLIVATKMKEVLAYNLPLRYRLFSVDGYDGGLLPIQNYVTLERLFLTEDEIWPDGRLRQQLREIPPARLLSLLNVKYVITDKTQDVWIDDVFYDLEHTTPLGELVLTHNSIPDFQTMRLGIVSYLTGTNEVTDGTPVARVTVTDTKGTAVTRMLNAGEHTAEGLYAADAVAHRQARIGHHWRNNEQGNDYIATLDLGGTLQPESIAVRAILPDGQVHLRGLTLIDDKTGTNRTLSIHPAYRQVHSGDVKVYQNLDVLPRAFVVHRATVIPDKEEALATLSDPAFDPRHEIILAEGENLAGTEGESDATTIAYEADKVRLSASLDVPGYLVLTDTYYPGWVAEVDGQLAPIRRADLYFRAVPLEAGTHEVIFRYQPDTIRWGLIFSIVAWIGWGLAVAVAIGYIGRKSSSSV